jgi:broad specificity phosphatase PhoE/ribonuclease HI
VTVRAVVIKADGGSRGNPGPSAYGAVLLDADTGEVLAEDGSTIGVATNNVAEYSGLIAGLKLAAEFAPGADIEVRMDSKLVVEQMSGNWKIKHPDMVPLAMEAHRLAPFGTTYTWVPREQNKHADRLANEALDGLRSGVSLPAEDPSELLADELPESETGAAPDQGWSIRTGPVTTLILIRHGMTEHSEEKRFSGGAAGANPPLNATGREQVRRTADWLAPTAGRVEQVISSPLRRTLESAEMIAERWARPLTQEPRFAEMDFGTWDGLTAAEVAQRDPAAISAWMRSLDSAPGGGETFRQVRSRVLAALESVLRSSPGGTVAVVSHVTPIKVLVAEALGAPLEAVFRMELSPASVTVVSYHPSETGGLPLASLRMFNARPTGESIDLA